jgi:hypothetical protein
MMGVVILAQTSGQIIVVGWHWEVALTTNQKSEKIYFWSDVHMLDIIY